MKVTVMKDSTIERSELHNELPARALVSRFRAWVYRTFVYSSRLDVDTMPDRVRRDLGFLDGREPRDYFERWP
ncbi:hypothetical protein F2982_15455 [Rhizobium sp. BG4]|jgi:hypothetical protein|nr:hypothetical protein F2982_15455 [Rhizobium sp. BG4]